MECNQATRLDLRRQPEALAHRRLQNRSHHRTRSRCTRQPTPSTSARVRHRTETLTGVFSGSVSLRPNSACCAPWTNPPLPLLPSQSKPTSQPRASPFPHLLQVSLNQCRCRTLILPFPPNMLTIRFQTSPATSKKRRPGESPTFPSSGSALRQVMYGVIVVGMAYHHVENAVAE